MNRILRINLSILILAIIALLAAPVAHAQQQPPYPPPPYPPQPYPPPYPPPPYPPQGQQQQYPVPLYHQHRQHDTADFSIGATRQLTQPITPSGGPSSVSTTDSTGVLASLRLHPMGGAGVELNYQYTQLTEQYRSPVLPGVFVNNSLPTAFHEATGAFLFESHMRGVRPFLALGGGGIDFIPSGVAGAHNQWRGAGLAELGFDIPANRHLGVRIQGRSLFYRAPNFNSATLQSRTWVATVEPAISVYLRW
jgi:hypothetical protein